MKDVINIEINTIDVRGRTVFVIGRVMQLCEKLRNSNAREHMGIGLARRLRFLHSEIGAIVDIAFPRRKKPLTDEEQIELSLRLNSFYLHIRGCLDNLAWCIAHELKLFEEESQEERISRNVALFGGLFLKKLEDVSPDVVTFIRRQIDWHDDLKSLRDPVAHRIPIYAVPAVLTNEEGKRYKAIYQRQEEARLAGDLELASKLFEELNGIGSYVPCFAHSLSVKGGIRKVYPQISDDLSKVLDLVECVLEYLSGLTTG